MKKAYLFLWLSCSLAGMSDENEALHQFIAEEIKRGQDAVRIQSCDPLQLALTQEQEQEWCARNWCEIAQKFSLLTSALEAPYCSFSKSSFSPHFSSAQFSPDGTLLAINTGRKLYVVNAKTATRITDISYDQEIYSEGYSFNGDGSKLVAFSSADDAPTVYIHDSLTGVELTQKRLSRRVDRVVWSDDGSKMFLGKPYSHYFYIWDMDANRVDRWDLEYENAGEVSRDGNKIFLNSSWLSEGGVLDVASKTIKWIPNAHNACMNHDGSMVVSYDRENIYTWDVGHKRTVIQLPCKGEISQIDFIGTSNKLSVCMLGRTWIGDPHTGSWQLLGESESKLGVHFNQDASSAVVIGRNVTNGFKWGIGFHMIDIKTNMRCMPVVRFNQKYSHTKQVIDDRATKAAQLSGTTAYIIDFDWEHALDYSTLPLNRRLGTLLACLGIRHSCISQERSDSDRERYYYKPTWFERNCFLKYVRPRLAPNQNKLIKKLGLFALKHAQKPGARKKSDAFKPSKRQKTE